MARLGPPKPLTDRDEVVTLGVHNAAFGFSRGWGLVSKLRYARSFGLALVALAVLAALGAGRAAATLPTLYVNYDATCHFTMSLDNGSTVGAGTAIPYGTYNIAIATPFSFSAGGASCDAINFSLTGPGVSVQTTLGDGDSQQSAATGAFQANGSYTASDTSVTPGTSVSFTASSTAAGAPASSGSSSSSTSGGSSSGSSALGTPIATPAKKVSFLGTLTGMVSTAGKLTLTFKGKPVATLTSGSYTVAVTDKSSKSGFVLGGGGQKATTVTTASFKGKHSSTVNLTPGQWYYYPKAGGAKLYFVVIS
jgi:hypothetical protein